MKAASQFFVAVRLMSTVKDLSAQLTLIGPEARLLLFCQGENIVYFELEEPFRSKWLQALPVETASELRAAGDSLEKRIEALNRCPTRSALVVSAKRLLFGFCTGGVEECKLKAFPLPVTSTIIPLKDFCYDCAQPFLERESTFDDLLPGGKLTFRLAPDYLVRSASLRLTPEEGYLLSRLENSLTLNEILSIVPGKDADARRRLLNLWAFGVVDSPALNSILPRIDVRAGSTTIPSGTTASPSSPSAFQEESIEDAIASVNETYQQLPRRDFYSLLSIAPGADMPEIKAAYYKLARRFHPDRFYGVNDPVLKEKIDVIFSAVNIAYETLKSATRRLEYDSAPAEKKRIAATTIAAESPSHVRLSGETLNKVADDHYRRAQKAYEEGNYYQAVQFLRSATQIRPEVAKYWRQLGISLSQNPQWRKEAEDSFNRAMDLEPKNPENHLYLGFLYKNSGLKLRAKKHFQSCLDLDQMNSIADRELRELEAGDQAEQKKGILGGLFKKK